MATILSWTLTVAFAVFGLYVIVGNYAILIRWFVYRKHSSLIPLLGGTSLMIAFLLLPIPSFKRYAWLPLLIDLGCAYSALGLLYAVFISKAFKK